MYKKISALILVIVLLFSTAACETNNQKDFENWNDDSFSLSVLTSYVDDVTNNKSENFIPEEDRIAVFDMDGTLCGEKAPIYFEWCMFSYRVLDDPDYKDKASEKEIEVANKVKTAGETGEIPKELEKEEWEMGAKAFSSMTLEEYDDYVSEYLKKDAVGFPYLKYSDMWYEPMLEVVRYLQKYDFQVYICSGTDTMICRNMIDQVLDIKPSNILGSYVHYAIEGQEDKNQMEYQYQANDKIVRTDDMINKNVKFTKVETIINYIGQKPVLSFGNSSGDTSMATFVTADNDYQALAFMVVADDDEREYGDKEKASITFKKWDELGMISFSMKDDFKNIYKNYSEKEE